MVINESAARLFGYAKPADAIGRKFSQWGRQGTIIGVIQDFHYRSLQNEIQPLTIRMEPGAYTLVSVNIQPGNYTAAVNAIEEKWKELIPNRPFTYFFMDEFFDRQYRSEERFGKLFFYFALLAIIISCLGLLGLASYSALQRTREIGIRKVMGASVSDIVRLLSKDFLKLVIISFIIATPLAWYCMYQWVKTFAYQSTISWWIFIMSGILALVIAVLTISYQAIKAAITDPVKSMRSE
jgi:putative ABC transport system permease protein